MVSNQHKYAQFEKVKKSNISDEMPFRAAQIEAFSIVAKNAWHRKKIEG